MSYDNILNKLQKLFEENKKSFDKHLFEGYAEADEYNDQRPDSSELDDQADPGDENIPDLSGNTNDKLPSETHEDIFPQPDYDKGKIYINPKAIPNDYSKGHIVTVYRQDTDKNKVRTNKMKLAGVHLPFSAIQKDEQGREFVTKDSIKQNFVGGKAGFVIQLLKRQPNTLDRYVPASNKGEPGEDIRRVQTTNPNVQEPSGDLKGDPKQQDALRRYVQHRVKGTRGGEETGPTAAMQTYPKDVESGTSEKERMKQLSSLSPEEYKKFINWQKETGSRDVGEFIKSLRKVAE